MKTILHKLLLIVFVITNQLVHAQINSSSFSAYTDLAVATNGTINAATGDLDGDGKLDLVTANETTGVLSIFKNTSSLNNISFASRIDSVASNYLTFIHLVDLNGDGKLDVLGSTGGNNTVVVYKNVSTLGNILLEAKQIFGVGSLNAACVWFGDLDGDNKKDIVISNSGGSNYSILRNTSTVSVISFATSTIINAPALVNPSQVIIADLDGDNKNDIVFFNNYGNEVLIYKNLTTTIGTIAISTSFVTLVANTFAHRGDIADIDGDNKPDIVASNRFSNNSSVFRNTSTVGNISFATKVDFAATSNVNTSLLRDIDNDGKPELIQSFGTGVSSKVGIYQNFCNAGTISTASFGPRVDFVVGNEPRGLTIGDLDNDGKLDIVTANYYSTNLSILRNTTIPSNSLVAYYPFNGNAGDSSGFGNHGVVSSGATITTDKNNKPAKAYYFDGSSNAKITATSSGSINLSTYKAISVSFWFKSNVTSSTKRLISIQTGTTPANSVNLEINYVSGSNKLEIVNYNQSVYGFNILAPKVFALNTWNYVCLTVDSNNLLKLYVNDSLNYSTTVSAFYKPILPTLTIGNHLTNAWNFIGSMDDVRIYNRAISIDEVRVLASEDPSSGLVAHYPFNGNPGDSSGYGNHGTLGTGSDAPVLTSDRFGQPNKAYYFDGNTDIINVAPHVSLRPNKTVSIAVWVKTEAKANGTWNFILTYRHGPTSPFDSYKIATFTNTTYNNRWAFGIGNNGTGNQVELINKFPKQDGVWTHIATVCDGVSMKIYTNGQLDTTLNINIPSIAYSTGVLAIGNSLTNAVHSFKGSMDDLRIYDRALTISEVRDLAGLSPEVVYYTKATGSINQLSTWGTNPDGTGTAPLSFDSSYCKYNVVNNNTTLSGSFKIGGANNVLVFGDGTSAFNFPIAVTDTISCDSMYLNTSATLTVSGTLQSAKFNTSTSSTVQYIGSNPQTIAAGTYENMVTSASTKTLTGDVTVRGVLAMISTINCNNNELTLGTSATSRGTLNRSSGTIVGRFSRWFANTTNAGTTGLFPIGTSTKYTPIQIEFTTAPTVGGKLTCEFIAGAPGNTGLPQFDFSNGFVFIDKASIDGVVRYTATGITGGTFTATFTANNYVGVFNYSNLRLLQRNIGGNWNLVGNAGTNTGTNAAAVISRSALTMLTGELGIGGDQSENPLPVKLTNLTAKLLNNQSTQINWQTSFEFNSDKFIVQRSLDKNKWTNRGEIKSKGNSTTTQNYSFIDDVNGLTNVIYYRLLQVDMDGTNTTSKIVSVQSAKQTIVTLQVYPNPTTDKFTVTGLNNKAMLFDITGKQQLEILADGEINIAHLPAGMYFLRTDNEAIKIVKKQ